MKKIHSIELSFLFFYIIQAFLFSGFISKSISLVSYCFILYLILSIFLGIGILMLFCYLFNLSNKNIFYNIKNKFLVFILILISLLFSIYSLEIISSYINYIYLKDIDKLFIMISFMIVGVCLIKKFIYSVCRCSTMIVYLFGCGEIFRIHYFYITFILY